MIFLMENSIFFREKNMEKCKKVKKRPVGRPKKKGPKRERRKKIPQRPKSYRTWNYKIVSSKNNRQNGFIGKYSTLEDAYEKLNELTVNNKVFFPSKVSYTNNGSEICNTKYEYLLLEKKTIRDTFLRNEYGKLVKQVTNSETWNIIDKRQYEVEETFGLWGYNARSDRKTFIWIYDNIIIGKLKSVYDIERILLYKNKIIIKNDNGETDIVFCKTISEAIRFYQKLEELLKNNKQIFLIGDYSQISDKRRKLEEELMTLTGWTKKKLQMSSTSEHKT